MKKEDPATMPQIHIPQGYTSLLSIYETQKAIGLLNRLFEDKLSGALRLHRVSAPLFVSSTSGLNDDLNGVERPCPLTSMAVRKPRWWSTPCQVEAPGPETLPVPGG